MYDIQSVNWAFSSKWNSYTKCYIEQCFSKKITIQKQGKSEGFDSCDWPSNLTQIGFKSSIFRPCDLEIWWPRNMIRYVFFTTSSFNLCIISDPSGSSNWRYSPETANLGQNRRFFWAVWPSNLTYDLENNRAPLLFYFKLCASFRSHWWNQTGVTVRKRPIWVKFDDF